MQLHNMLSVVAGVLLCLVVLQPSCCVSAAFVETFEPNPFKNTSNYLPGVWTQLGRFVEDGKAMVGEPKGWSLFLDAANPWAETTMLQWDGSTPAQLVFEVIRYDMPDVGCALKLLNTTDGEEWAEFHSQEIRGFPFKAWKTVRLTMPLGKGTGSKFGLRFQYVHACLYGGACCPGITINNLVLPAKAPAAAAAVLKACKVSADAGTVSAATDTGDNSLGSNAPSADLGEDAENASPADNSLGSNAPAKDAENAPLADNALGSISPPANSAEDSSTVDNLLGANGATNSIKASPTSTLRGKPDTPVNSPSPDGAAATTSKLRPGRDNGTAGDPANTPINASNGDPVPDSAADKVDKKVAKRLVPGNIDKPVELHGSADVSAEDQAKPPVDALNTKADTTARPGNGSTDATQPDNASSNRQPVADSSAASNKLSADNAVNTAPTTHADASQPAADKHPGSNDLQASATSRAEAHNGQNEPAGSSSPDWQKAADQAIGKLCKNPSFTALAKSPQACKLWGDTEAVDFGVSTTQFASGANQFPMPLASDLPQSVYSRGGTSRALALVSPACSGRAVARAVFKATQQPAKSSRAAGIQFQPFTDASRINASPVVRCFLTLDDTKEGLTETQRALTSKEDRCCVCSESDGCPSVLGSWFSDAFTLDVPGCQPGGSLPHPVYVQMVLSPGWKALLAKVEVCRDFSTGCFDPDYEAQKLQDAAKCTAAAC